MARQARGQMFSYDFLFSSVGLVLLLTLYIYSATAVTGKMDEAELRAEMEEAVQISAGSLLQTPGDPSNWEMAPINETGVRALGLVNSRDALDPDKAAAFFSITDGDAQYNATLPILGLSRRAYAYNASLEYLNGTVIYSIARLPPSGINQSIPAERFATYNGTIVRFKMVVWRE